LATTDYIVPSSEKHLLATVFQLKVNRVFL